MSRLGKTGPGMPQQIKCEVAVSPVSGLLLHSSIDMGFVLLSRCDHLNHQLVPEGIQLQPKTLQGQSATGVVLLICRFAHGCVWNLLS